MESIERQERLREHILRLAAIKHGKDPALVGKDDIVVDITAQMRARFEEKEREAKLELPTT